MTGGQGDDVARLPLLMLDVRATFCIYATRGGHVCGSWLECFIASSSCYYTDCFGYIELAAWCCGTRAQVNRRKEFFICFCALAVSDLEDKLHKALPCDR